MVTVRTATPGDVNEAVDLLMQAAGSLLTHIFGNGDDACTRRFLASAWQNGVGQYGHGNHWVAESDNSVVGLVTSWHDKLPKDFDRQTLDMVTQHFGLDEAVEIVMRSQVYSSALCPPTSEQLAIGHLAVKPGLRGNGIGTHLLDAMLALARRYRKNAVVLDVETCNQDAIHFYTSQDFSVEQTTPPFQHMVRQING